MNFQVFHVNPGKKLKKKDLNNNLSHFMSVFPNTHAIKIGCIWHLLIIHLKKYKKKFPSVWFDTVEYLCAPFFFHPFCPLIDDCATHPLTFAGLKFHLILFDDLNFEIGH